MVFSSKCLTRRSSSPNGRGCGMTKFMMFSRKNKHNQESLILHLPDDVLEENKHNGEPLILLLPDDVLEMCLVRLSLENLMNVRLVCKQLYSFTTAPRFLQMRRERYLYPWFILSSYGKIPYWFSSYYDITSMYALDPSRNQWSTIPTTSYTGLHKFSVARIHNGLFLVGGYSKVGLIQPLSIITHNNVWYLNVVTRSWRRMPSMKYPRSVPVVGVTRDSISTPYRKAHDLISSSVRIKRSFLLIVVGGKGDREEPLYYGEIYDSLTDKWTNIKRLPSDFGRASSGTVCGSMFYVCSNNEKLAAYDIERGYWTRIQTSPPFPTNFNAYRPQLLSSNGRLFLISHCWTKVQQGNVNGDGAVKKIWELDLADLTWTDFPLHSDVHLDWGCVVFATNRNPNFEADFTKNYRLALVYNYIL